MANETAAIVGIYGEIDRAVQASPLARLQVAQLLSPDRDPELSWYDEFQTWLGETAPAQRRTQAAGGVRQGSAFPDLEGALNQLAAEPPTRPREHARRMFAIAAAARAFPEMKDRGHKLRKLSIGSLKAIPSVADDQAGNLHKFLAGEGRPDTAKPPGSDAWWHGAVGVAGEGSPTGDTAGMQPRPCTGTWVKVPGIEGPVDALETSFLFKDVDFTRAVRFLDPMNWQRCRPDFWCKVDLLAELPDGQRRYREEVSTHCDEPAMPGFSAETELLLNFMWIPDEGKPEVAVANYQLAPGRPAKNDRVLVDEGSIVVSKTSVANEVRMTTTKRIKFSRPFSSGAMALFMCALGYGTVSHDLMACAATSGKGAPAGTDFPGVPANAARSGGNGASAPRPLDGAAQAPLGGFFQEGADLVAQGIRDWGGLLQRGLGGAGWGTAPRRPGRPGG